MIRLAFTKQAGRFDLLVVAHADGRREEIANPKQRIIPHDMVHYAVETEVAARGFLGRVAAGEAARFEMAGSAESDGVERLVEVLQGDGWSGGTAFADELIALYHLTCEARGCPPLAIDAAAITAIRARIADLDARWSEIPIGGTLELTLATPPSAS